ncbi:unnamed protein product [Ambrosiozyma monospora]|uniref:Unnamed protein product n=1 Tax=Ambrosiozyma monospora TaxID=43982 RepID=A0A9W7DJ13_AMBMO|nr:unnamed protein product [Ambrosiozyma monospora]
MEKYTDKHHPLYVPGTYSIYTSALIRKKHEQHLKKRSSTSKSQLNDSYETSDQQYQFLANTFNYKYSRETPLENIPDIKSRYGIILLPQPTNSVNDPFNWSNGRKAMHFFVMMLCTALTAAISNDASAPQDSINDLTHISYDDLNNSAGILFIGIGFSIWLFAPLASMLGRRITLILGMIFSIAGSVWFGAIQTPGDVYGSQLFIDINWVLSSPCMSCLMHSVLIWVL